jgi:hypothetical protein
LALTLNDENPFGAPDLQAGPFMLCQFGGMSARQM